MLPPSLAELAALYRIETEHFDGIGNKQVATPERLAAILTALGVPLAGSGEAEAAEALRSERVRREQQLLEPCAVWFDGEPRELSLRLPSSASGRYRLEFFAEQDPGTAVAALEGDLADLPAAPARDAAHGNRIERRLAVTAPLAHGYYRMALAAVGQALDSFAIVAPAHAFGAPSTRAPSWGVFAPIYALRSRRNAGTGDLGDLLALARWARGLGARYCGTLPLLAGYYDQPYEPSPYSPATRLFWNELYIDLGALAAELSGAPATASLTSAELEREIEALRAGPTVDYRRQMALTRQLLFGFSEWAWSRETLALRLEQFAVDEPRLADYARFRAELEARRTTWPNWPEPERGGDLGSGIGAEADRLYHIFVQWVLAAQLDRFQEDESAGLYLDLPVGVNGASYDLWRERDSFATGADVGAPPDELFRGGQNWALPPLHPERQRQSGYRYFIDSIRAHMRRCALLRVDHVLGLHRLYWVPQGAGATEGLYVHYPADELYGILLCESHRHRCAVAGEDLGTVPECVRPMMERRGLHRLHVAQFCRGEVPPANAVASLDTHDTRMFARFADEELAGDTEQLLRSWTEELAASPAAVVLVTLEDLWLEREPQNVPGSPSSENWRRRMRFSLPELMVDERVTGLLAAVAEHRKKAGFALANPPR